MNKPLVSILIRTCQRPWILKRALNSVRNQTYQKIQVVIVEDGESTAESLIKDNYSDLNYIYEATGKKIGRSAAGNRAMEIAEGEYYNFLDDDDELLPEHVDILVRALDNSESMVAYSVAEEKQIVIGAENDKYKVKRKLVRFKQPFNRLLLYKENYLPIQSVLFSRALYERLGGFRTELDSLEDWDLWVRYSTATDYVFVDKITSYYYVIYNRKIKKNRMQSLMKNNQNITDNFSEYKLTLTVKDINGDLNEIIDNYKSKEYIRYLKKIFRAIVWGER